jgi:hypothetical protein
MRVPHLSRKLVVRVVLWVWRIGWCAIWSAMVYFGFSRPRTPIPSEGRIYPYNDHGTVVYLTSVVTQK